MDSIQGLDIAASGLTAQRLRMDVIASNIANAETTRTPGGGPYRRTRVVFSPVATDSTGSSWKSSLDRATLGLGSQGGGAAGVAVTAIVQDPSPSRLAYDPGNPDANAQGYVEYPNVDVGTEMADMLSATRAYEANVTVVNAVKDTALKALQIGRG
jgi:flagellar basal-body rod protein FlgC